MNTRRITIVTLSTTVFLVAGCHTRNDAGQGSAGFSVTSVTSWSPDDLGTTGTSSTGEPDDGTSSIGASDDSASIDKYILNLPHFTLPPQQGPMQKECEKECLPDTEKCVFTYYGATDHFGEFVAFEPNSATLWPGSIARGRDAQFGLLTPVSLPRAPMTFSVSLANLLGSPVGAMDDPKLSSYRETLLTILGQGTSGETPASIHFDLEQVYSSDSLSRLLKTDVSWGKDDGNKITGMFDFVHNSDRYKLAVDFVQSYYTVDIDTPNLPSDLFLPEVTLDEVQAFMDVENPPMLVQSITYGRRAVVAIESTHDLTEVKTAFSAAIKAVVDVNASVNTHDQEVLDSLDMKVFVLGGSGDASVKVLGGFDGLKEFLKDGATYSADSPGAPIAYKLTYLDNSGTKFALTTEFAEASCTQDMQVEVTGVGILVEQNGEGGGSPELSYEANVDVDGQVCTFVSASGTDHGDGKYVDLNMSCPFTLSPKLAHSLTVNLWTKESGGVFDKTKEAWNSITYNYDPAVQQWAPLITGATNSLQAANGNSGETLSLKLDYSVKLL